MRLDRPDPVPVRGLLVEESVMREAKNGDWQRGIRGFTMIELLVVIGIMAVAAAAAVPSVAAYMRSYAIKGASEELKSQVQTARTRAIMKNVNQGVTFLLRSNTSFQFVIEDDMVGPPFDPTPRTIADLIANLPAGADPTLENPQLGLQVSLPAGIQFIDPVNGGTLDSGFRFNRFGRMSDPGSGTPDAGTDLGTGTVLVSHTADGAWMTIQQNSTGLERTVHVAPGGRSRICAARDCAF
jgi:prepilin-type N-terminal cleavage/methylation domain-containing protein